MVLPRPSPDTEKEFWRATSTYFSSQERSDVTVFKKNNTIIGKLLNKSLEWLLHNFSKTHHFTDHGTDNC